MNEDYTKSLVKINENVPISQSVQNSHIPSTYSNDITKIALCGMSAIVILRIAESFLAKGNINDAVPILDKLSSAFQAR